MSLQESVTRLVGTVNEHASAETVVVRREDLVALLLGHQDLQKESAKVHDAYQEIYDAYQKLQQMTKELFTAYDGAVDLAKKATEVAGRSVRGTKAED